MITLVIIGVVAALTIPNLMQKYTEQATVKQVQKFYSNLSNAYSLAVKENGNIDDWGITGYNITSSTKIYEILFKPYFKITKDCGGNNTGDCIVNTKYYNLNNTVDTSRPSFSETSQMYKIVLADGADVWWVATNSTYVSIYYDANGKKGPNTWGKDLFYFPISNDVIYLRKGQSFNNGDCKRSLSGVYACTGWVVYKGNMDYLHCDLTWDKNSCKDK